jgi:hypothetical protein
VSPPVRLSANVVVEVAFETAATKPSDETTE